MSDFDYESPRCFSSYDAMLEFERLEKEMVRKKQDKKCQKHNEVLDNIANDINKLKKVAGDRVYVAINDVFDVIDKYREVDK